MALTAKIDWEKDGDFTGTGENVTSRVLANPGVSLEYGRDQSTALAPMVAGRGGFTLNNASGDYNPLNSGSPIFGLIKPARPVEIKRTVGGNTYTLFDGHTDDTPLNPNLADRTVQVSLLDYLADFRGPKITTEVYTGVRTGDAIGYVLDELGWPAPDRDIDPGVTIMPFWFENGEDAFTALDKILRSEGPPALLTMAPGNIVTFRDRHHRLLRAASTTSQDTWYGATTKPVMSQFTYDAGWRNIVNHGGEEINVLASTASDVVWSSDAVITMANAEVKIITAALDNPAQVATTPVSGTDYTVLSGAVAVSLIVTSGSRIPIQLTATGATVISGLQLRASTLETAYSVQISATDATSITDYGQRDYPTDLPWCNEYDAQAILDLAVATRAEPLAIIEASFVIPASDTASSDAILARDLSDRVTVESTAMDMNQDFYIESIKHDFGTELDHTVTIGCEEVPASYPDDPASMLIFDSTTAGQRWDEGNWCT